MDLNDFKETKDPRMTQSTFKTIKVFQYPSCSCHPEATPESMASSAKWDGETSMIYFASCKKELGFETLKDLTQTLRL